MQLTVEVDRAYEHLVTGAHAAIVKREVETAVARTLMSLSQTFDERDAAKPSIGGFRGVNKI